MKPKRKVYGKEFNKNNQKRFGPKSLSTTKSLSPSKSLNPKNINANKKSHSYKNLQASNRPIANNKSITNNHNVYSNGFNLTAGSNNNYHNKDLSIKNPSKNSFSKKNSAIKSSSKIDAKKINRTKKSFSQSNNPNNGFKKSFQIKSINLEQYKHFKGVYYDSSGFNSYKKGLSLYTKSVDFKSVYGEKIININDEAYRFWDPKRSKICSAIHNGISQIGILPGKRVLYLGASSGTTVSHVSDILGEEGIVFAIEFSDIPAKKLYFLSLQRENILPILADARYPKSYFPITGICDVIFQDISQKDQIDIFFENCKIILKDGGFGILSLKTRSIDVRLSPKAVFSKIKPILEKNMTLVDYRCLEPFEEGHYIFVLKN